MGYYRVGFAFTDEGREKLLEWSKKLNCGQTPMIEAILFAIEDEEMRRLVKKGLLIRKKVLGGIKELRKEARKRVNDMGPEELEDLLKRDKESARHK